MLKSCTQIICSIVFGALLSPAILVAQDWTWRAEPITTEPARQASLAVDADGDLHLSYETDDGHINYAYRAANKPRWFTMPIGGTLGYSETSTHITLDKQGHPHICYTPGILQYSDWDGKEWHTQRVSPGTGEIAYSCSVAVGSDGTVHLTWYQYLNSDGSVFCHVKHAVLEKGVWMARTVDFAPQAGKWNSLVLDANGAPNVSYSSFDAGEIKFAVWNGKDWSPVVVDSRERSNDGTYNDGMGNSLAVSPDGDPAISYYDDKEVRVAWRRHGKWVIQTVEERSTNGDFGGWVGYRSSIGFDSKGFPHVCYDSHGVLKHAFWDGSKWQIQVLAPAGANEPFRYNTMAVGKDGSLYIAFRDAADGHLKLLIGTLGLPPKTPAPDSKKTN